MRVTKLSRLLLVLTPILLVIALGGCASTKAHLDSGGVFASAGIGYVDALPAILDESFDLSVSANSLILTLARDDLTEQERADRLGKNDELLRERLSLLRNLRRHSLLLRSYFVALKALTVSDSATGITEATNGLVGRMAELRPEIADKAIGGIKPQELIGPVVQLTVGAYQSSVLKRELSAHGEAIERELALQNATVQALVEDMQANADLKIQIEELNPIFTAFVEASKMPSDWSDRRIAAFRRTSQLMSLDDVQKAAANLHETWIALVEKRTTEQSLNLLIEDVERLLALASLFESSD